MRCENCQEKHVMVVVKIDLHVQNNKNKRASYIENPHKSYRKHYYKINKLFINIIQLSAKSYESILQLFKGSILL